MRAQRAKWLIPLLLVLVLFGYGLFEARYLIAGPTITVTAPAAGATIREATYTVEGRVRNVAHLWLNGQAITTNRAGAFEEVRVTPNGRGTVLVEADDRFGRHTSTRIDIWGQPGETIDP